MPIPKRGKNEDKKKFMERCMGDGVMNKEFPDQSQRAAICMSKACEGIPVEEAAAFYTEYKQKTEGKNNG